MTRSTQKKTTTASAAAATQSDDEDDNSTRPFEQIIADEHRGCTPDPQQTTKTHDDPEDKEDTDPDVVFDTRIRVVR